MSYGKMNTCIDIITTQRLKDEAGFTTPADEVIASIRAYREEQHGSQKWASRAAFSEATDLFRFRIIPGITITTSHAISCNNIRFDITSVENVNGRGMYVEVLAKRLDGTDGAS